MKPDIPALRAAEAKMTPGDWRSLPSCVALVVAPSCIVYHIKAYGDDAPETLHRWRADADGIALLRNSIIPLCDEIERLRAENEELRSGVTSASECQPTCQRRDGGTQKA